MFPVRIISTNTLKEPETKQDKEDGMDDKRMIGDYTVLNSMYPYCYLDHGIKVRICFSGKRLFEECLKSAVTIDKL